MFSETISKFLLAFAAIQDGKKVRNYNRWIICSVEQYKLENYSELYVISSFYTFRKTAVFRAAVILSFVSLGNCEADDRSCKLDEKWCSEWEVT